MEATALCIRLLMTVLMLLVANVQQSYPQSSDAAFRIVPTRLQLFEYESVSFTCEGFHDSAGWKVRSNNETIKKCFTGTVTTTVSCTIDFAFASDSGEYWCEGGGGERSNTVNITVAAGSVILESPALPVMEGDAVTLSCRKKQTSSNITADFYKDGRLLIGTSSRGNMTILSVSKSDEGLYKCHISGAGESAESRLAVSTWNRGEGGSVILESPALPVMEGDAVTLNCRNKETSSDLKADFYKDGRLIRNSSTGKMIIHRVSKSDEGLYKCHIPGAGESPEIRLSVNVLTSGKEIPFSHHYCIVLWIVVAVVLVLQLLVIGLLHWKKQLVSLEVKLNDPNKDMYAVIKKDKKKKDAADADNLSLCLDTNRSTKPQAEKDKDEPLLQSFHSTFTVDGTSQAVQNESGVSSFTVTAAPSAATDPPLTDQDPQYASIQEIIEEETPY